MRSSNIRLSFGGEFRVSVLRNGIAVPMLTQKNMILDQGFDNLATVLLCDLFLSCATGIGRAQNYDAVVDATAYSINATTGLVTRTGGATNFTDAATDEGRVLGFGTGSTENHKARIIEYVSATQVYVAPKPASNLTSQVVLREYRMDRTGLIHEIDRTDTYDTAAGQNGTTIGLPGNGSDIKRAFIFDATTKNTELDTANSSATGGVLTRSAAGWRAEDAVGKLVYFPTDNKVATVTGYTSTTLLSISDALDGSGAITTSAPQPVTFIRTNEGAIAASTYSMSGTTTVTRITGTRDFRDLDIGKKVFFVTAQKEYTIVSVTSATAAVLSASDTIIAQAIQLHGFVDHYEIGCSDNPAAGNNLNIRVRLTSSVRTYCATGLNPAEQLLVNYLMRTRIFPYTPLAEDLATKFTGGDSTHFAALGDSICETYGLSGVRPDGTTNDDNIGLEPSYAGEVGLSTDATPLQSATTAGKIRSANRETKTLTADAYVAGSRQRLYRGQFELSEAVSVAWRSMFIMQTNNEKCAWTFLFDVAQTKNSTNILRLVFLKNWDFDLDL